MIKAKVLFAEQFFLEMPKASLWSSVRMGLFRGKGCAMSPKMIPDFTKVPENPIKVYLKFF